MENAPNIEVRKATAADAAAIIELNEQLFTVDSTFDRPLNFGYPTSEAGIEYFRRRVSAHDGVAFVAQSESRIVGYLVGALSQAAPYRRLKLLGELENMFVIPDMRGQGVGKSLVDAFAAWCRQAGVERIQVVASADNERAIAFYLREGFKDYNIVLEREL